MENYVRGFELFGRLYESYRDFFVLIILGKLFYELRKNLVREYDNFERKF